MLCGGAACLRVLEAPRGILRAGRRGVWGAALLVTPLALHLGLVVSHEAGGLGASPLE